MNVLDIGFVVILGWAFYRGFKSGFVVTLFNFLAVFFALYAGIHFSDVAADWINATFEMDSAYVPTVAFTITFLLIGAMIFFAGKVIHKVVKVAQLSLINKLLGAVVSIISAVFLTGALLMLLNSYDEKSDFISNELKEESLFFEPIIAVTQFGIPYFEESKIFLKNALNDENLVPIRVK